MASKSTDIIRFFTRDENVANTLKQRIEKIKELAKAKKGGMDLSNLELLEFLLNIAESELDTTKAFDRNTIKIQEFVKLQMMANESDNEVVMMGENPVHVNKRRISTKLLQDTIKCTFGTIKKWFDENQEMLEKHHAKCGIGEQYNRTVSKCTSARGKDTGKEGCAEHYAFLRKNYGNK